MSTIVRLAALIVAIAAFALTSSAQAGVVQQVRIPVGDLWFCDESFQNGVCETRINAGDSISWDFSGAALPHTTAECGASCDSPADASLWDSGTITDGSTFQFTFEEPGTYLFRCNIHPNQMRGSVIVVEREPEPEPPDGVEPDPLPDGPPAPVQDLPDSAPSDGPAPEPEVLPSTGAELDESSAWVGWALLAILGATSAVGGIFAYRRGR